jgi:hypothetical protein
MRTVGRPSALCEVEIVRELTQDDLARLDEPRPSAKPPAVIKRLHERHHALARFVAAGLTNWEASALTGYEPSRISILRNDPTFRNLVSFYGEKKDALIADMHLRLSGLSVDAIDELRNRLEEKPEEFTNGQLLDMVKAGADRSGHGPSTTNVQVNVGLAQRMDNARRRVEAIPRTIDITPEKEEAA